MGEDMRSSPVGDSSFWFPRMCAWQSVRPGRTVCDDRSITGMPGGADALTLANQEAGTLVWFALQTGPSTFAIFDAFAGEAGRKAHLAGPIAAALMANASELLSQPPKIEQVDVLAAKVPT